jgi:aldose sugar dehydrogenase
MKLKLFYCIILLHCMVWAQNPITNGSDWTVINITSNNELDYPNEITYGPDNFLWITERVGKKVVKVDAALGGSKIVILDLTSVVYQTAGQDGLLGMAIHPDLYANINTANNYVYLAYTYDSGGRKLRIARYTYNSGTGLLNTNSATTIIDGIEASNDHNGGRLKIGSDLKLYYSIGDQGFNQGNNSCFEIRSQYLPVSDSDYSEYKGKILRLNLDGSIPSDNPMLNGVTSHVFSLGHRNAQGLIFSQDGKLYSSEHGPKVDDEINLIQSGKNYGWPEISGYYDDFGYEYCDWSSSIANCGNWGNNNACPNDVTSLPETTSGMPLNFSAPLGTLNSTTNIEPSGSWFTWPTVGPSSIDIYEGGLIPNWDKSLLITSLKRGTIFRTKLNATGEALEDGTYEEFHSSNDRYRDIAMDPDGITIYAITDNTGGTSGPSGTTGVSIANPGVVMKIQFTGTTLSNNSYVQNEFSLIPNPAANTVKLRFDQANELLVNVQIIDVHGRIIEQINNVSNNHILNTTNLSNGLYFVKIYNRNYKEMSTKKLIIMH